MAETTKSGKAQTSVRETQAARVAGAPGAAFAPAGMGNRALALLFEATGPAAGWEREAEAIAARVDAPGAAPPRVTPVTGVDALPEAIGARIESSRPSGSPLPESLRGYMERRLGADLSAVRTHQGEAAHRVTEALDARALTIGGHVYFNRPAESGDRVLLAHELVHVLQQRAGAGARIQRAPKAGAQKVQEASPEDKRQFLLESIKYLHASGEFHRDKVRMAAVSKTKVKVNPAEVLPSWKKAIASDLGIIDTALGGDPKLHKDLKDAYQDMVQGVMAAAAQAEGIQLHEAYQKYREHIHELGWPEASVETDANKLSDAIPKEERARIQVITTKTVDLAMLGLDELFKKKAGTSYLPPEGTEVVLSGTIPEDLKKGLTSVGAGLITHLKPPVLKLNSTINLALDLSKYGGDYGLYRFTFYQHTEKKKAKKQLLIERLGAVGMEGLRATAQDAAKKKFAAHKFSFVGTWDAGDQEQVLAAVNLIADSILTMVDGVKFARAKAAAKPDTAGDYKMETHTITLYDLAFKASAVRFGMPGAGLASAATFDTAHEIGHAIDRAKLRAATIKEAGAKAALKQKFGQYQVAPDEYELKNVPLPVLKEFNELMGAAKRAGAETERTVTESGMRFQPEKGTGNTELRDDPKAASAFKTAAQAASAVRISPYAEESWEEYFAESFALYITDPATLKRLRPKLHEYFEKKFSETKKKKK